MGKFQELKVWQKAKDLAVFIDKVTDKGGFIKEFSLRDPMRRAAISIASNIAEGDEFDTDRQSIRFFYIAKGSSAELLTQAEIAMEVGYLSKEDFSHVEKECKAISSMLTRLIQAREKSK